MSDATLSLLREVRHAFEQRSSLTQIFHYGDQLALAVDSAGAEVPRLRVAVLGALTTDFICHAVRCAFAQEGILPVIYQAPFASYRQEALNPNSGLYAFDPELVLLAPDWRDVVSELPLDATRSDVERALQSNIRLFEQMWSAIEGSTGARIIQHTFVPPLNRFLGVAERLSPASPLNQVRFYNDLLFERGRGRVHWLDVEALAYRLGTQNWSPGQFYYSGKLPFDQRRLHDYLLALRGAWRAASGRTKKLLVVDLDNTLWGGVIGDDGPDGIALGQSSPHGAAFQDWQKYLKALSQRGVALAICSKNTTEIAVQGLHHDQSILRPDDFAAIECTWDDKARGLRKISASLQLGLDAMVFVDDNPAECDLVRRELPEVEVVHLGSDPAFFPERLDAGCWFDLQQYTAEDMKRAQAYSARRIAVEEQANFTDLASYLGSLEMVGQLERAAEHDVPRIAQLEQKTNQFNLTTRRYSEQDIRGFLQREDVALFTFRLKDRFGDHGLVSSVIASEVNRVLRIDSWVMSCRVFSRSAEQFIFRGVLEFARERDIAVVEGFYQPTNRNGVVADLYSRLGFKRNDQGSWERSVLDSGVDDLISYIRPAEQGLDSPLRIRAAS